jgi:hypothetical protein
MADETLINLDQNSEFLSDTFSVETADLTYWLTEKDEIEISFGFGDKNITKMKGDVDNWSIKRTNKTFQFSMSGRDKIKTAIETQFQKIYFFESPYGKNKTSMLPDPAIQTKQGSGTADGGVNNFSVPASIGSNTGSKFKHPKDKYGRNIPFAYGNIWASRVAKEAVGSLGNEWSVIWDTSDYLIVNAIEDSKGFNDTIAAILRQLVEPLNQTEMYRTDIYIQDTTIYVKKRRWPYKPTYILDLNDIKIKDFSLVKAEPDIRIKNIFISRDEKIDEQTMEDAELEKEEPGEDIKDENDANAKHEKEDRWIIWPEKEERLVETQNPDGVVIMRQYFTTWKINGIVIKEEEKTYKIAGVDLNGIGFAYELAEEKIMNNNYEDGGPYSFYAKLESTITTITEWTIDLYCSIHGSEVLVNHLQEFPSHFSSMILQRIYVSKRTKEVESYTYNSDDEIIVQNNYTEVKKYDKDGNQIGIDIEEIIKSREHITKDQHKVTVNTYENGIKMNSVTSVESGQMPGPKKVGVPKNQTFLTRDNERDSTNDEGEEDQDIIHSTTPSSIGQSGGGGISPNGGIYEGLWWRKIKVHDTGKDIEFDNNLFSRVLMENTGLEMKVENLKKKHTLSLSIIPMPWIKKGDVLQITGIIDDGTGNEMDFADLKDDTGRLLNFLVQKATYNRNNNSFTGRLEAVGWI